MKKIIYIINIYIVFGLALSQPNPPSLFNYNQGTFQAFYFFRNVMIDSVKVSPDDWVATFNCVEWNADSTSCTKLGQCVGTRKWNTLMCGSGVCDLPAIGSGGESAEMTIGYLEDGNYPVFLIYDASKGVYYNAKPEGDVQKQKDICRNGYPYCYTWENFGFYFIQNLNSSSNSVYMDCSGKLNGQATIDSCGICGGSGPQFKCDKTNVSYCTEYEYEQKCIK